MSFLTHYNPKAYLLHIVKYEDLKAHDGKEPYERKPKYYPRAKKEKTSLWKLLLKFRP